MPKTLIVLILGFALSACALPSKSSVTSADLGNRRPNAVENADTAELASILAPYVKALDRDLWVFRYEGKSKRSGLKTVAEVNEREARWAARFFDPNIVSGSDVGPGVYVATDPVASVNWGFGQPNLFAFSMKRGAKILVGDEELITDAEVQRLNRLAERLSCRFNTPVPNRTLAEWVGHFRYEAQNLVCREQIAAAFTKLGVQALTYIYSSVFMTGCRNMGTALSIVDWSAVDEAKTNLYPEGGPAIEGSPETTPFVKRLFAETQGDFFAQTKVRSLEELARFRKAYGFFDHAASPDDAAYDGWRSGHLLKCGPPWSIEVRTTHPELASLLQRVVDPVVTDLIIRLTLTYKSWYQSSEHDSDANSVALIFNWTTIPALLNEEFAGTGLRPNLKSAWLTARQGFQDSNLSTIPMSSLGEPGSLDFSVLNERLASRLGRINSVDRAEVWRAVEAVVVGPQTKRLYFNELQRAVGGVPALTNLAPSADDRARYLSALRHCLDLYSNPKLTVREALASACAMPR